MPRQELTGPRHAARQGPRNHRSAAPFIQLGRLLDNSAFRPKGFDMIRRTSLSCSFRYWGVLVAAAAFTACSDDKPATQDTSPSATPQQSSGTPPSTSVTTDAAAAFFAGSKAIEPTPVDAPTAKGDLTFTLDVADVQGKAVRIRGWAFRVTPPHQHGDRITVLLVGST